MIYINRRGGGENLLVEAGKLSDPSKRIYLVLLHPQAEPIIEQRTGSFSISVCFLYHYPLHDDSTGIGAENNVKALFLAREKVSLMILVVPIATQASIQ